MDQSVTITFKYGKQNLNPLLKLEEKLEEILGQNEVGEYDGHEIATDYSDGFLFFYGPNAEELFKLIKPVLEENDFLKGANVNLKFGEQEDANEIDIDL